MSNCKKNISRGCCFAKSEDGQMSAVDVVGGHKMEVWDWLQSFPKPATETPQMIEVRFKNTRKAYYVNSAKLDLKQGDIIAVEGTPGVDVGIVTMTSDLVLRQIKRTGFRVENGEYKKVLRMATTQDIQRWSDSIAKEHATMISSRQISADLGLDMKIGDVEYQGDGMKAIFYYIADGRVDFRELIKVLFERFRVRVEMKQIGARQEAGRIGGISPCGRELCCSSWINSFSTIGIGAARSQDISPNPQKLAGQCGKLKCCLNYELDVYVDAKKQMPRVNGPLHAVDGAYYLSKTDALAGIMYFSPSESHSSILIPLSNARVREIQAINSRGEKVDRIEDASLAVAKLGFEEPEMQNVELQDSLTRFDTSKRNERNERNGGQDRRSRNNNNNNNRGPRNGGNGNGNGNGNGSERREAGASGNVGGGERRENQGQSSDRQNNRPPREPREPRAQGQQPREQREQREHKEQRPPREPRVDQPQSEAGAANPTANSGNGENRGNNRRWRGNNRRKTE